MCATIVCLSQNIIKVYIQPKVKLLKNGSPAKPRPSRAKAAVKARALENIVGEAFPTISHTQERKMSQLLRAGLKSMLLDTQDELRRALSELSGVQLVQASSLLLGYAIPKLSQTVESTEKTAGITIHVQVESGGARQTRHPGT